MKTYSEVLEYLYARLPMYQRIGKSAFKKDLTNTLKLLEVVGNPHKKFKSVHIAGTNGKGSSAHSLAAIMQKAGYKTGLYTSPHLKNFTERIKINGKEIPKKEVVKFVTNNQASIESVKPSFFEVTVAMAFDYFANEQVDIAIIETGLGGRLDSTNVISPEVCLITTIGLEHTDILGDTIEKIAYEKAGIIKSETPVVIGQIAESAVEVIAEVATRNKAKLVKSRPKKIEFDLSKAAPYFELNLPGVLSVVEELVIQGWEIPVTAVKVGIENYQKVTGLKGRFQTIQNTPKVIADVSHNKDGLDILFNTIDTFNYSKLHLIFGTVKDKDLKPIFNSLPKDATYYFTQSSVPRSLEVGELRKFALISGIKGESYPNVNDAKKAALEKAADDDLILITGSTFVVAELDEL